MSRKHSSSFGGKDYRYKQSLANILPSPVFFKQKLKPEFQKILESPSAADRAEGNADHAAHTARRRSVGVVRSAAHEDRLSSWQRFDDCDATNQISEDCLFDSGIHSADDESRARVELFVNDVKCDFLVGDDSWVSSNEDECASCCSIQSDESVFLENPRSPDAVVVERFGHQLSPVSHLKPRSGSLGTIELTSIHANPFLIKDKTFRGSIGSEQNVKTQKNCRQKKPCGIYNQSLTDDDCEDVNDGSTLRYDGLCHQQAKHSSTVVADGSNEDDIKFEIEFDFVNHDGNNNENKPHDAPSRYSTELLTWYKESPLVNKSTSLPRRIPPPPASPRTRQRLTKSSAAGQVFFPNTHKASPLYRASPGYKNLPGIHVIKKSPNHLVSRNHSDLSPAHRIRSAPHSPGYSPSKSATLPPSHRLSPSQKNKSTLKYSNSDTSTRSQPSSPQSNVRRCKSLLASPSLLRKSPTFPKKTGSYKNLGDNLNESVVDEPGSKVRKSQSNSAKKPKSSLQVSQDGPSHQKKGSWKPVNLDMMTNYEGYYPDESSDGEVTDSASGQSEHHHKSYDSVVFDVLKVSPEDFASQLTLLDLAAFREIQPIELSCCGWDKKDKVKTSPNVVQMSQRFNNTSFYVIHEILHARTLKIRAEVLTHFIRIAKKLHDLNNLHSLMAVISSLTSSSIFRLTKTWALVNKHYKATFDRLRCLMTEDNNRVNLRKHIDGIRLPCIPFLGMYLADLINVDSAHPDTGGLESHERTNKMNNILRVLAEFQQSNYDHLREIPHIKTFLQSVKYIEELQKFVEEENYKLSLKIEPNQLSTPQKGLNSSREELSVYDQTLPRRSMTPPTQQLFKPGHRKSHSLGRDIRPRTDPTKIHKSGSLPRSAAPPRTHLPVALTTSLLDDSIISPGATLPPPPVLSNSGSIGSSRSNSGSEFSDDTSWSGFSCSDGRLELGRCQFEGCLRRKTVLKHGKKPPMSSWTKYWVCLFESQLVFYQAKTLRATEKHHFKKNPFKMISIHDWMVLCSDDPGKLDSFQLSNPNQGDIYRFQSDSNDIALVWVRRLQEAIKGNSPPEKDLINLDDT